MERIFKRFKQLALMFAAMFMFASVSFAAQTTSAPAYGTMISNQASLTYTGYDEESRSMDSNIVIVYVDHLYMVDIYPPAEVTIVPGQKANFMHTVINKGNGKDTYELVDGFDGLAGYTLFEIKYALGTSQTYQTLTKTDNKWILPEMNAGDTINVLVTVTTPSNITTVDGSYVDVVQNITATSIHDSSATAFTTETIHYAAHAAVQVFKGLSKYEDYRLVDTVVGVGLDVGNLSTKPESYATYLKIEDQLDTRFIFDASSKTSANSANYAAVWVDYSGVKYGINPTATAADLDGIRNYKLAISNGKITFEIIGDGTANKPAVPVGTSNGDGKGMLLFNVKVLGGQATPVGAIPNTATYTYQDLGTGATYKSGTTNTVSYEVLPTRKIAITDTNTIGYTYIGGQYTFAHTIKNLGDVAEGTGTDTSIFTIAMKDSMSGWVSKLYHDVDSDGKYTAGIDVELKDMRDLGGLAAGDSVKVIVHVWAPSSANIGDLDVSAIDAVVTQGAYHLPSNVYGTDASFDVTSPKGKYGVNGYYVKDQTQIKGDYITIEKFQSVDDVEANYTKNDKWIKPGKKIYYKILVKNTGDIDAKAIVIGDIIPKYTSLSGAGKVVAKDKDGNAITSGITTNSPGLGVNEGTVTAVIATLPAGASAALYFDVKIDNYDYAKED